MSFFCVFIKRDNRHVYINDHLHIPRNIVGFINISREQLSGNCIFIKFQNDHKYFMPKIV